MNYILDILLMLILVLFFLHGWKKGFACGLIELVGAVAAAVLSVIFGGMIAQGIYTAFMREPLAARIAEQLATAAPGESEIQAMLDSFPAFIGRALEHYGVTAQSLAAGMNGGTDAAYLLADAISPVITTVLRFIIVVVLFIALLLAARLLAKALGVLFSIPLLRQVDEILGAFLSLLKGLIVVWLICASLNIAVPMLKDSTRVLVEDTVHASMIFDVVYEHNPVYALLK